MDYRAAKRRLLKVFIAFLGLTAVVAIVAVLRGEFGDLEVKILLTTITISAASICSMGCAAFVDRRGQVVLGLLGIGLSVLTTFLVVAGVWELFASEAYWRGTGVLATFAVAFPHAFLITLPDLNRSHRWVQLVGVSLVGVLALQLAVALVVEIDSEPYYQILVAVAILVGLATLVTPILARLRRASEPTRAKLVLVQEREGIYRDDRGRYFRVAPIDPEEGRGSADSEP